MSTGSVVVGVDGSDRSNAAVAWAADEAAARQARLLVVHAIDIGGIVPWAATRAIREQLRAMLKPVVDNAIELAHARHPDLDLRGKVLIGSPTRALLVMSKAAELVVVGRDGRGALTHPWLGNVPQRVLAHAACTAVAVGASTPIDHKHITRVIVGCADDDADPAVLEFGFNLAHHRKIPLLAVHAVHQPSGIVLSSGEPRVYDDAVIDAEKRLAKELDEWHSRYPDVDGIKIARTGKAARVVTEGCKPHDLIVIGHHHHGPMSLRQLGHNTSAILHAAECSVAVVHVSTAREDAID